MLNRIWGLKDWLSGEYLYVIFGVNYFQSCFHIWSRYIIAVSWEPNKDSFSRSKPPAISSYWQDRWKIRSKNFRFNKVEVFGDLRGSCNGGVGIKAGWEWVQETITGEELETGGVDNSVKELFCTEKERSSHWSGILKGIHLWCTKKVK